jgi:hypothetical protein
VSAPSPVAKKLGIKPGMRAIVLNAPDGVVDTLTPLPDGASVDATASAPADVVVLFAHDAAEVDAWLPKALAARTARRLLWIVYPKGGKKAGTDLNRDILWAHVGAYHLVGVTLVAFDERWSAMRFRPADEVGS